MNKIIIIFSLCFSFSGISQIAHDNPFMNSRFDINCSANILLSSGLAFPKWWNEIQPLRTYAMDEPEYWVSRRFFKLDLERNRSINEFSSKDSIFPFMKIIENKLKDKELIPYASSNFVDPYPFSIYENVNFTNLEVLFKVDFYFNYETLKLNSFIVGVHLLFKDSVLANIYYPELKQTLKKYKVKAGDNLISYADYFDNWNFFAQYKNISLPESPTGCQNCTPLFEQQSEFDALIMDFLIKKEIKCIKSNNGKQESFFLSSIYPDIAEVKIDTLDSVVHIEGRIKNSKVLDYYLKDCVPHGKYEEYWLSGNIKEKGKFEKGKRKGKWFSYYSDGTIKAEKNYGEGLLNKKQKVYHPNGNIFLEYDMEAGEYNGIHKTYYASGELMESGQMKNGYVTGEWYHCILVSEILKKYLQSNSEWYPNLAPAVNDSKIEYSVKHIWNYKSPSCPYGDCHKFKVIGEIK